MEVFDSNVPVYFSESERGPFEEFLESEAIHGNYFIVLDRGSIVACGGYDREQSKAGLNWGMVSRGCQGQGIGSALLVYRLDAIRADAPAASIYMDTSQHTVGFYEKFGFEISRRIANGYGQGLHQVFMVLKADDKYQG